MWSYIINIHSSKLLSTKTKGSRINESYKKKKKSYKIFKELTKYKNDYQ